jgi:hypothetical protein
MPEKILYDVPKPLSKKLSTDTILAGNVLRINFLIKRNILSFVHNKEIL